ncbi:MAG: DinB family protein, partial [Planctomycetota bacterium]
MILKSYLGDLEDADFFKRPHAGCNHIAWQLGHLISAECRMIDLLKPGAAPELPDGFAEKHAKERCGDDSPDAFHTKDEYLSLYDKARAASAEAVATFSEADLDAPNPHPDANFRQMFPTVGSMWVLAATHPMMHVGQFVPVRRETGKPIVI